MRKINAIAALLTALLGSLCIICTVAMLVEGDGALAKAYGIGMVASCFLMLFFADRIFSDSATTPATYTGNHTHYRTQYHHHHSDEHIVHGGDHHA